jgi:hypothetical protein
MMKKIFFKSFFLWLPFAALITFTCLLSYLLVQQDLRMTANDPQIQIAEDVSQVLASGAATPQEIVPPGQVVNIATSLDPYLIVFDSTGAVLGSSAVLNGKVPAIPPGVFASVRQNGEDRFTWQPEPGVRSAVVVDSFPGSTPFGKAQGGSLTAGGGFVLAGRSIREIEIREDNILHLTELAWIAGIVVMFMVIWAVVLAYKKEIS